MHLRRDAVAVERRNLPERALGQRRQVRGGGVRARLIGRLRARDDRRDSADVELLTVAVVGPMVVLCELRVAAELSRQETGSERDADDHADIAQARLLEEELGRSLAEDVEDDLD